MKNINNEKSNIMPIILNIIYIVILGINKRHSTIIKMAVIPIIIRELSRIFQLCGFY
ncbi:MAG: hypothetical protein LBN95_02940 [Prevotellaceae bacterium]|nr:hypothetical protein [Prevotellaceae bacterium]